ncbi:MAG: AsmA-like C-terminal region-containing protein, partial [Bacteroidota bacterium]
FKGYQTDIESYIDIMDGQIKQAGTIHLNPNIKLESTIEAENLDVEQCFQEMKNFDQKTIRAEHLTGQMNGKFLLDASWSHNGQLLEDRLEMQAAIQIDDGSLKNFEMLEKFSNYIKIEDLKNIKFERINNLIEIKNRQIYLPVMFIQSNACNLTVQGLHTFDNKILYNLKVNAGQVIGQKFQKHQKDLRPQKARKKGWLNLYYFLNGSIDDFEYKAKPKMVKSNFEQSDEHRYEIKQKLIEVFGHIPIIQEPVEWQDIPEYTDEVEEEEEEFIEF